MSVPGQVALPQAVTQGPGVLPYCSSATSEGLRPFTSSLQVVKKQGKKEHGRVHGRSSEPGPKVVYLYSHPLDLNSAPRSHQTGREIHILLPGQY